MEVVPERRDPSKEKYWRWLRLYMCSLGAWPREHLGEPRSILYEAYHKFLIVHLLLVMYSQTHYIVTHYATTSMFELGHMLITLFLNFFCYIRFYLIYDKGYGPMWVTYFTKFHLFHYEYHDEYSLKLMKKIERFSLYITIYYIVLLNVGCPLFSLIPWTLNYVAGAYHNPENVTLLSAVYLATPFDTEHDLTNWAVLAIYGIYFTYTVASAALMHHLCLYLITFQIMGHILILEHNLTTIPAPASKPRRKVMNAGREYEIEVEMFTEEENAELHEKLKRLINHQRTLQAVINDIADRYDVLLLTTYMYHLATGCVILLELDQGGKAGVIQYGLLGFGIISELVALSVVLEQVCTMSDRLGDAVYSMPWQCMSVSNQKTVLLFLMRVQTPMVFKAMGVAEVGVKPMAAIIKTSLSYFAFLKTLD